MKAIVILFTMLGILFGGGFSSKVKNGDFHIYTVSNKDMKINPQMIEEALKSNGFVIGENANIQAELLHLYKDDNFQIYNNISFYHKEITVNLLKKQADAGFLVPMGMVVYQDKGEDDLHIVVARADMQARIIGAHPQELKDLEEATSKVVRGLFPKAIHTYNDTSKPQVKDFLTKYTLELKDADFEDVREELEENFEEQFGEAGFAMPSYFDLTDDFGVDSPYDFYVTYAICKLDALRAVIKVNPEVAVLGPCTTMIYKKKNENKIVMGFSSIHNWINSANVKDKEAIETLLETQRVYEAIVKDVTKN